jgi:hypothetical protein
MWVAEITWLAGKKAALLSVLLTTYPHETLDFKTGPLDFELRPSAFPFLASVICSPNSCLSTSHECHQIVTWKTLQMAYNHHYRHLCVAMKTRFAEENWQCEAGRPEWRACARTPARSEAFPTSIHLNILQQGHCFVTLTIRSFASHDGTPELQVTDPLYHDSVDLRPADFAPCREDDPPETAAELLLHIHARRPLTGKALDCARRFLKQWPVGPQLPD